MRHTCAKNLVGSAGKVFGRATPNRALIVVPVLLVLAGCDGMLPSDEEVEETVRTFEDSQAEKIRQDTVRDTGDGFSSEAEVNPNHDSERYEKQREESRERWQ